MGFMEFRGKCFMAAARHGFECWELYYSKSSAFSVRVRNGEIEEYKNSGKAGLSFRGVYNGKMGYAYTERLDEGIIDGLLSKAIENAQVIDSGDEERLFRAKLTYPEAAAYNKALDEIPAGEKIEMALNMERAALAADGRVKSVNYCTVANGSGEVHISNSYGLELSDASNAFYAYLQPQVEENGVVKTWLEFWQGRGVEGFAPGELAEKAVREAISYLPAKTIPSGSMPVVFSPLAAADLFGAFLGVFFAERAQKGFSLLGGKVGEAIASPAVTIRDDGSHPGSISSAAFDSEGVPCRAKTVVGGGVLKTLLYNLKSAGKDNAASTGNGFKASFRAPVETACTNFYVQPSGTAPGQIIGGIPYGVWVADLAGLHSGANSITGDFSLSASGMLIENGALSRPVEQIVVSGNFYELLRNIKAVGSDLRFGMPGSLGAVGMPSILAGGLKIAGE